jgi:hypothetical protein
LEAVRRGPTVCGGFLVEEARPIMITMAWASEPTFIICRPIIFYLTWAGRNVGSPLLPNLLLVKERRFFGKESSPLEAIRELG